MAAVGALGLPTLVAAAPINTPSTVDTRPATHTTIWGLGLMFGGQVTSSARIPTCLAQRSVSLWNRQGDRLGQTRTNSHGGWQMTIRGYAGVSLGRFYATVRPTQFCRGAWSTTIPYFAGYPGSESPTYTG
jgi:hypothetical protein